MDAGTVHFKDLLLDCYITPARARDGNVTVTLEDEEEAASALRAGVLTLAQQNHLARARHLFTHQPSEVLRQTDEAVEAAVLAVDADAGWVAG